MTASSHRYDPATIRADYARAAGGLALSASPLLFLSPNAVIVGLFAGLAVLFALFGARTWIRHRTEMSVDDEKVRAVGPWGAEIAWQAVDGLKLAYYATRRDRQGGWMQMSLKGGGRTIKADSALDGFDAIVSRAAQAAIANGVDLSLATRANLRALDVPIDDLDRAAGRTPAEPGA
jgi:uncharacterized membrane protein